MASPRSMLRAFCALLLVATAVFSIASFLRASLDARVMCLVVAGLVLRLLRCILGPLRRCSGHWFVQCSAMAAYYLPSGFVVYIASDLWRSSDADMYHLMWCLLLLPFSASSAVEMAAYARRDNPPQRWSYFQLTLSLSYLTWVMSGAAGQQAGMLLQAVFCFSAYMYWFYSMQLVNSAEERMKNEDRRLITIRGILGRSAQEMGQYQDICLSYSYCQILTTSYFGITRAVEGDHPHTHGFTPTELQSVTGYERVFNIVEVQLAFLHDYFFTTYHSTTRSPYFMLSAREEMKIVLKHILPGTGVGCFCLFWWLSGGGGLFDFEIYDTVLVGIVMPMQHLIGWINRRPLLPRYWRTIWNATQDYYPNPTGRSYQPTVIERFVEHVESVNCLSQPYWQDKLGQYSLMEDYDRPNYMNTCISLFNKHMLSHVTPRFIKHHPGEEVPVSLPNGMKRLLAGQVAQMIRYQNCQLTNGSRSLEDNLAHQLCSWTLGRKAHTILIWHIATWYCSMFLPETIRSTSSSAAAAAVADDDDPNVAIATALSGYCTYLVAFLPELLPWDRESTMRGLHVALKDAQKKMSLGVEEGTRLQHVRQKAKYLLGLTSMSMREKHDKIKGFQLSDNTASLTTFEKGIKLGKDLANHDPQAQGSNSAAADRWKVMADFWVETILYIAPSDNAGAHVERLAQGGEFLTHIWALLSNTGIKKHARDVQDRQQQAAPRAPYNA